jgi:hypothetical protein
MFSDVLSDVYSEIIKAIDPEYSYESIYTPDEVIEMLAKILYVIVLSDGLNPDGTYNYSKTELKRRVLQRAKRDYLIQMKKMKGDIDDIPERRKKKSKRSKSKTLKRSKNKVFRSSKKSKYSNNKKSKRSNNKKSKRSKSKLSNRSK